MILDEHVLGVDGVQRIPCASLLVRLSLTSSTDEDTNKNVKIFHLNEYDNSLCEPVLHTDINFQASNSFELHQEQQLLKYPKTENFISLYNSQFISIYNSVLFAFLKNTKAAENYKTVPEENVHDFEKISTATQDWLNNLLPPCNSLKLDQLLDYSYLSPYNKEAGLAVNINQLYNMPSLKKKSIFNAFSAPVKNTVFKVIYSIYPGSSFYNNDNDMKILTNRNNFNNDEKNDDNNNSKINLKRNQSSSNILNNIFNKNKNDNDDNDNSSNINNINNNNDVSNKINKNNFNPKSNKNISALWGVKFTENMAVESNLQAPLFTDAPQLFYPKNMNLIYNNMETNLCNDIYLIIDVRSVYINDKKEKNNNNNNNNNSNNNVDLKSYWTILPLSKDARDPEIGKMKSNRFVNSGIFQLPLFEGNFPHEFVAEMEKLSTHERSGRSVFDLILEKLEDQLVPNDMLGKREREREIERERNRERDKETEREGERERRREREKVREGEIEYERGRQRTIEIEGKAERLRMLWKNYLEVRIFCFRGF